MIIAPFSKTYEKNKVLDFPGLEIFPGQIYAIIGSNGSGKSTFAKILAGVLNADRGNRFLGNATVGYMPQKNYAFRMSAKANVLLGGRDEARADELMESLQIRHLAQKRADKLSGGETARMALARLMMSSSDVVFLDEPTAAMDMETTLLSEQLIVRYVRQTGAAMIIVTHSLQQARRIADHVLYFHKGDLLEHGPKELLLTAPSKEETRQFLEFYGV